MFDPGADGEVAALKAERDERNGNGDHARRKCPQRHGDERVHACEVAEHQHHVAAKAEERLLSDADHAAIAGKQVPHHREGEVAGNLDEFAHPR